MRILLNAPPGYGKSRAIAKIAAQKRRALIFVRSHLEGLQMARYVEEYGGSAGLLFGRKTLCPFGAENLLQCLKLREVGVCRAKSRRLEKPAFDIDEIYKQGACPYEVLHVSGRHTNVIILPIAYISKISNIVAISDLFEEVDFVALDEVHNLLTTVSVQDDELYSKQYCVADETPICLALPLIGELVKKTKSLLAASASVLRHFSQIFTYFLNARFVEIEKIPGIENLEIDLIPAKIRYNTRTKSRYVELVTREVKRVYQEYGQVIVFFPNKELAMYYLSKMSDLPVSDQPLGDINHVIVTYYGSPISEGINLNVKAGVFVGFPIPNIKSRELWLKIKILYRLGFNGYKYGILFTAVNHIVQAVGRVLRDLNRERKYILFIDDRYTKYKHLLPRYLSQTLQP